MQLQTLNIKTIFIGFLWGIVAIFFLIFSYHISYLTNYGYTDIFWLKESVFGYAITFTALFIIAGFSKRTQRKRFYKKRLEILNLFENQSEGLISLNQILSKRLFSKSETKGLLEYLVEKKILLPSFSEEQELIYKLTDKDSLDNYLKKIH